MNWNQKEGDPPKDLTPFGMPGPGGSLGTCAVCGKSFVTEVIMGESVQSFSVPLLKNLLYAHDECVTVLKSITDGDWTKLPEGPLREQYSKAADKQKEDY